MKQTEVDNEIALCRNILTHKCLLKNVSKSLYTLKLRLRSLKSKYELVIIKSREAPGKGVAEYCTFPVVDDSLTEKTSYKKRIDLSVEKYFGNAKFEVRFEIRETLKRLYRSKICKIRYTLKHIFELLDCQVPIVNKASFFMKVLVSANHLAGIRFEYFDFMQQTTEKIFLKDLLAISFINNPFLLPRIVCSKQTFFISVIKLLKIYNDFSTTETDSFEKKFVKLCGNSKYSISDEIDSIKSDLLSVKQHIRRIKIEKTRNIVIKKRRQQNQVSEHTHYNLSPLKRVSLKKRVEVLPKFVAKPAIFPEKEEPTHLKREIAVVLPGYIVIEKLDLIQVITAKTSKNFSYILKKHDTCVLVAIEDFTSDHFNLVYRNGALDYSVLNQKFSKAVPYIFGIRVEVTEITPYEVVVELKSCVLPLHALFNCQFENRDLSKIDTTSGKDVEKATSFLNRKNLKLIKIVAFEYKMKGETFKGTCVEGKLRIVYNPLSDIRYKLFEDNYIYINQSFVGKILSVVKEGEYTFLTLMQSLSAVASNGEIKFKKLSQRCVISESTLTSKLLNKKRSKAEMAILSKSFYLHKHHLSGKLVDKIVGENLFNEVAFRHISNLKTEFILLKIFEYLCKRWYPVSTSNDLDNAKFIKFLKQLPNVINIYCKPNRQTEPKKAKFLSSAELDVIFAKCKEKDKRKISFATFQNKALFAVAARKYPWLIKTDQGLKNQNLVLSHFVCQHIIPWRETSFIVFVECQKLACNKEASRQLNSLIIQTNYRSFMARERFLIKLKSIKRIQHNFRCYQNWKQFKDMLRENIKEKELIRLLKKNKRLEKDKLTLWQKIVLINNQRHIVKFTPGPKRGIKVVAYSYQYKFDFKFCINYSVYKEVIVSGLKLQFEEERMSRQMKLCDQVKAWQSFEPGLLYKPAYLAYVVARFKYIATKRKIIIGRKPNQSLSGKLLTRIGCSIKEIFTAENRYFVVDILAKGNSIMLEFYHNKSRAKISFNINQSALQQLGIRSALNSSSDLTKILDRTKFCSHCKLESHRIVHTGGGFVVTFQVELDIERKKFAVTKLQSHFRRKRGNKLLKDRLNSRYRKHRDRSSGYWYYFDTKTNKATWKKPLLFGAHDIAEPSPDLWIKFYDASNAQDSYFHPYTGRTSIFSKSDAVSVVARLYRKKQNSLFTSSLRNTITALKLQRGVRERYELAPSSVANKFNFSLFLITTTGDIENGIKLFQECAQVGQQNPLIKLIGAVIKMFQFTRPVKHNFEKALSIIEDVKSNCSNWKQVLEPTYTGFIHWGCTTHNATVVPFLLCALFQSYVYNNRAKAHSIFVKCLSVTQKNTSQEYVYSVEGNYKIFCSYRCKC